MRLFASFVTIYMILLSVVPCGDERDCKINPIQTITISASSHNSENTHTEEACTPFCSCSCCSISMMKSLPFFPVTINETFSSIDIIYSNSKLPETAFSIWQPPKLV